MVSLPNCKLDISKLNQQFGKKNKQIEQGVNAAFRKIAPEMEDKFKYYQQTYVYAVTNPKVYERTNKLLESTKSEVEKTKLFVYADPKELNSNAVDEPYSYLVTTGYRHWGRDDSTQPRDWVEPMAQELKEHLEQDGSIVQTVISEIQKRV